MKKMTFMFVWIVSFLLLLLVCDQFLLRYPGKHLPLLNDFQHFYQDFRSRLIKLEAQRHSGNVSTATTVEDVLSARAHQVTQEAALPKAVRYLYLDEHGTINFADRLDDIPSALRSSAKALEH